MRLILHVCFITKDTYRFSTNISKPKSAWQQSSKGLYQTCQRKMNDADTKTKNRQFRCNTPGLHWLQQFNVFVHLFLHASDQSGLNLGHSVGIIFYARCDQIPSLFLAFLHVPIQPILKLSHFLKNSREKDQDNSMRHKNMVRIASTCPNKPKDAVFFPNKIQAVFLVNHNFARFVVSCRFWYVPSSRTTEQLQECSFTL